MRTMWRALRNGCGDVCRPPCEHGVEHRVLGFLDCRRRELDGVIRIRLGPFGVAFCDLDVVCGLLGVDALSNTLDVLVPIALDLVAVTFGLIGDLLRLGT